MLLLDCGLLDSSFPLPLTLASAFNQRLTGIYSTTSFVCVSVFSRILHLAIIHEEEHFARQLIDLFPPELMDIQNNLYQVSL